MSVRLIEGFDLVGSNADLLAKGYITAEGTWGAATGRFGGAGYTLPVSHTSVLSISQVFVRHVTMSFWWKNNGATLPAATIAGISDLKNVSSAPAAASSQMFIRCLVDGTLELVGDNITRASTGTGTIVAQTWHHIEIQAEINSAGLTKVFLDGIEVMSVTADFFDGSAYCSCVLHGSGDVNVFDDWVVQIDDTTVQPILGEHKIHTVLPNADTAQADFTGTFADIDDPIGSHDGDTTFISSSTLNHKSEFALGDLSESPSIIHFVQAVTVARKTDAGTKAVTPYIQSGTTRANAPEFAVAESYSIKSEVYATDPDTASAWTVAGVNALLVGFEITT